MQTLDNGDRILTSVEWDGIVSLMGEFQNSFRERSLELILCNSARAALTEEVARLNSPVPTIPPLPGPPVITPPVLPPAPAPIPTGWILKPNFSLGVSGTKANGPNGFTEAFRNTYFTNERSLSGLPGSGCVKMGIDAGSDGSTSWGAIMQHPKDLVEGDELWFQVSSFFPVGFIIKAQPRLKFLRIKTPQGYLDLYVLPGGGYAYNNEITAFSTAENIQTGKPTPFGEPIVPGVWEQFTVHTKFSSIPGQGLWEVFKNGVLMYRDTTQKTLASPAATSTHSYIFTYWNSFNNVGAPQTQHMFIDDVVLSTSKP